jgi:protein TonB
MRDPLSRPFASLHPSSDSWFMRVRENLRQLRTPDSFLPSSANGAPIHLPGWESPARAGRAQSASIMSHALLVAALAFVAVHPPRSTRGLPQGDRNPPSITLSARLLESLRGDHSNDGSGRGSGHNVLPTRQGNLPAPSSIQIVKPTIPENLNPETPVPPTILDPSAPRVLPPVNNIGLPWMRDQNNSSGRGNGTTIGDGPGDSIGDTPGELAGRARNPGIYQPGVTLPTCAYCPDPQYTDEAREARLQGAVTLLVLVGADGRASQIRIVKGIGLGLDDRAVETIRAWKFVPAHDAARRTIPAWVTVEAIFRLF